jgi:ankyrin repeat protein
MSNAQDVIDAVKAGDADKIRALLEADPSLVNAKDESGNSAILLATYYGRKEIVDLLRAQDVEMDIFEGAAAGDLDRVRAWAEDDPNLVNAFSHDGYTPLGLAAFFGHGDIVNYLLECGVEVNVASRNKMKVMPLHSAVASRYIEIARALLEHGAEVNVAQQDGFTPLHEAAQNGQEDMITLLLAHGADVDAKKDDGQTALSIAVAEGHDIVADALRRHGASE